MKNVFGVLVAILVGFSFLIFACQPAVNKASTSQLDSVSSKDEHHHEASEAILLNGTEKWKVDENMIVHIRNMEAEILAFDAANNSNVQALANKLAESLDLLTSNCTMKGQAHDELHKWLLPYIELVDEIKEKGNASNGDMYHQKLKDAFEQFNLYFN